MSASTKTVDLGRGLLPNSVLVKGDGTPVVFLHGYSGQRWDAFQEGLARKHHVFAPAIAGSDEPDELKAFDTVHDLVLYYDDVFRKLGLAKFDLVGHAFGGMMAAEYAAAYPEKVNRLVLIDALGLWRDDLPVANVIYQTPENQAKMLLGDTESAAVKDFMALPAEQPALNTEIVRRITGMASILHFTWPIPDRGLAKRLYRVQAPTLVLWGEQDEVLPVAYAADFASAIAGATMETIAGAGHTPQLSHAAKVVDKVLSFLGS